MQIDKLPIRIQNLIEPITESGCWVWVGSTRKSRVLTYGRVWYQNRSVTLHRLVYELLIGPAFFKRRRMDHIIIRRVIKPYLKPQKHFLHNLGQLIFITGHSLREITTMTFRQDPYLKRKSRSKGSDGHKFPIF